jgi:hypothetical protein
VLRIKDRGTNERSEANGPNETAEDLEPNERAEAKGEAIRDERMDGQTNVVK